MAFDFMSFAGGFADVIVDKVKAEEAQARADESWDRRFQKQQDAIDNRTRYQKRREREEEAKELAEKLSLLYTPEQSTYIMGLGTGAIETAVERGNYYLDNNQVPSEMFNMPARNPEIIKGAPIADASQLTETQRLLAEKDADTPFIGRFKPLTPKIEKAKGNWEAELVRLNHGRQTTTGDKQAEFQRLYDLTYTEYEKWKTKSKEDGAGDEVDIFSDQTRQSFMNSAVDGSFKGKDVAELDAEGRFARIVEGDEPEAYFLMNDAIDTMEKAYVENEKVNDPSGILPQLIQARRRANNLSIKAYKKDVLLDYIDAKKAHDTKNPNVPFVQPVSQQKYFPDPENDVIKGANSGQFRSGAVVQYIEEYTDAEGKKKIMIKAAMVSRFGVIG